jgi:hypothetical protein
VLDGKLRDGRFFCDVCRPSLLADFGVYEGIYEGMVDRASRTLGLELTRIPALVVESSSTIGQHPQLEAAPDNLCGLFSRDAFGRGTIHVVSHMTSARASAVLAHELAHAWQSENCPDDQGARVREGFAEWVAWKLLDGLEECRGERDVIEARTDDYGVGFRLFVDLESRRGFDGALWYARAARSGE